MDQPSFEGIGTVVQQPLHEWEIQCLRGEHERRPVEHRMAGMDQGRIRLHQRDRVFLVPGPDRLEQLLRRCRHATLCLLAALFLLANDRDDLRIATLAGDRQRVRGVAMRIDPGAGVGAVLHQHAYQLRGASRDRGMQRATPARQLGPRVEHGADPWQIAGANRLDQPAIGRTLHERLQLRPAREPIGARHHELRVVERERRAVGIVVVGRDLGDGARLAGVKSVEQFPRLPLELLEIWSCGERTGGEGVSDHDELLS